MCGFGGRGGGWLLQTDAVGTKEATLVLTRKDSRENSCPLMWPGWSCWSVSGFFCFFFPGEFRNVPLIFAAALANQRQERAGHCAFTILEVKRISDWSGQSAISLLLEHKNSL